MALAAARPIASCLLTPRRSPSLPLLESEDGLLDGQRRCLLCFSFLAFFSLLPFFLCLLCFSFLGLLSLPILNAPIWLPTATGSLH